MIQTSAQKELYLLELENGIDSAKSLEKCIKHGKAILKGTANTKYNFNQGYRTLWVFEKESTCINTLKRIKKNPFFDNLRDYFLFNNLDKIKSNFWEGWLDASGKEIKLYYI